MTVDISNLFKRLISPKYKLIEAIPEKGQWGPIAGWIPDTQPPKLYRIQALRDFGDVRAGDIGGSVHGHHNLSHTGNCWIYDNGLVRDQSFVGGNAKVMQEGKMFNHTSLLDESLLTGQGVMTDWAQASGESVIEGTSRMSGRDIIHQRVSASDSVCADGNLSIINRAPS